MNQFIESKNEDNLRLYINVSHIVVVNETGKKRCLIMTDIPQSGNSIVPLYYTVNESYDDVVALIKGGDSDA
jgi:hypothetical protein